MTRRFVERARRLLGWAAIGLALAWGLFAQLLWQVETRPDENHPPDVRLVVSAVAPVAFGARKPADSTSTEKPRVAAQPVLPDGESPAPCQLRRLVSTDIEVLSPPDASPFLDVPDPLTWAVETTGAARWHAPTAGPGHLEKCAPAGLPRPPPTRS